MRPFDRSFISGSPRLMSTLPCRHYNYTQAEVYRGDFDAKLKNPVMLVSETYVGIEAARRRRLLTDWLATGPGHTSS